jgi:hypothetical protein
MQTPLHKPCQRPLVPRPIQTSSEDFLSRKHNTHEICCLLGLQSQGLEYTRIQTRPNVQYPCD